MCFSRGEAATVWLALGVSVLLGTVACSPPQPTGGPGIWFEDLVGVPPPADEELLATIRWLRARLLAGSGQPGEPPQEVADPFPRIIFLSLPRESGPAEVIVAGRQGLIDAASRVAAEVELRRDGDPVERVKIDVVDRVSGEREIAPRGHLGLERGFDGLAFERSSSLAFLPGEVVAWTLVNSDGDLRASNIRKYLRGSESERSAALERAWEGGEATVRTFTTRSFFADESGLTPLERGHPLRHSATVDEMRSAALVAGEYLRRNVTETGRFVYSYLPKTDREKDQYNILRHAGTVYSMLELYEETGDADLLAAADRARGYLVDQIEACGPEPRPGAATACVAEAGFVKLGGNALAILALAKRASVVEDDSDHDLMRRLARWMTVSQDPSGRFTIHKQELATGEVSDFVSEYYPGEALLALVRLAALDGDPAWLDAAEAGAGYLITVRDGGLSDADLSHDHWLLYALNELYRARPKPLYLDHALRLASIIVAAQNRDPEFPDWEGSYYRPPRSTPTATRTEGLCAAHKLARLTGREEQASVILEAARAGVDFQLQTQFGLESVLYLRDPERALGGFHRSLTDFEIRIDYVQHNLSSLLCVSRELAGGSPFRERGEEVSGLE